MIRPVEGFSLPQVCERTVTASVASTASRSRSRTDVRNLAHQFPLPAHLCTCFDTGMVTPIRLETLGDLLAHSHGVNASCEKCGHRSDLDLVALILRLGEDFKRVPRRLAPLLKCSQCGSKTVMTQISYIYAGRSDLAGKAN